MIDLTDGFPAAPRESLKKSGPKDHRGFSTVLPVTVFSMKLRKPKTRIGIFLAAVVPLTLGVIIGLVEGQPGQGPDVTYFVPETAARSSMEIPMPNGETMLDLERLAAAGDAVAQNNLAIHYANGTGGVAKDTGRAMDLFQKAAEQGVPQAQTSLGIMYSQGEVPGANGKPDRAAAVEWWTRAAAQGNSIAQFDLGRLLFLGEGVPQDDVKAAELIRKSAEQSNRNAQSSLSVLYKIGRGVERSDAEAAFWASLAAEDGTQEDAARRDELMGKLTAAQAVEIRQRIQGWRSSHGLGHIRTE